MAMFITKSMLSKFNKVYYPQNKMIVNEFSTADHWQKLAMDCKNNSRLSKDMICRICAKTGCTNLMDKIDEHDIMSCIRMVSNVNITTDDALPKYICSQCLDMLKVAVSFKKMCETADRKFRKIINPLGDPVYHTYPYSKHDFQLILHQMKLKRLKMDEEKEKKRKKRERIMKQRSPKIKQFKCSPCDVVFSNKEKLMAHRRERQCMRRACEVCGQLVVSIAQHMRHIHKQSLPHKCPTCGKEFPIIARLKNHMMVHTNTFNFFCDLCPYKSKHKYYLVMHMRTHTGEKPYRCTHCPATFVNPSNLNKHKLTHQEKQFKCGLCEKAFRTNAALREHHEAAHMNIKHTCHYCGKDFCYKSDLRKHEIRYHNRIKRDYVGGEPTYKQVERLQKLQESGEDIDKWRLQHSVIDNFQKVKETGEDIDKWRHQPSVVDNLQKAKEAGEDINKWRNQPVVVERFQKMQDAGEGIDKWQQQSALIVPEGLDKNMIQQVAQNVVQATYIDPTKDYVQQTLYFTDVPGMMTSQQTHMVTLPPQSVTLQLPELEIKKNEIEVKLYEPQQSITYF